MIENAPTPPPPSNCLPSGEWTGFYVENHRKERSWMHLYLQIGGGQIDGEGTDYVGPWSIQGHYDLSRSQCDWIKTYLGKHQVQYRGQITESGIQGIWNIRGRNQGPFHIWPQSRSELTKMFLADDLENGGATQLLGNPFRKKDTEL